MRSGLVMQRICMQSAIVFVQLIAIQFTAGHQLGATSSQPVTRDTMNVPLGEPNPIVAANRRARSSYQATLTAGLERNRQAVAAHASGGGGHAAFVEGTTTRGHIWLLPPEMRRPWRDNMVGRPRTSTVSAVSGDRGEPLQVMSPLTEEQLRLLRSQYAITSASALPAEECAICFQSFELHLTNQMSRQACIVRLPCGGGHTFHFRCIEPWLRKGRLCPTCRQTVHPRARKAVPSPRPASLPPARRTMPPVNRSALVPRRVG